MNQVVSAAAEQLAVSALKIARHTQCWKCSVLTSTSSEKGNQMFFETSTCSTVEIEFVSELSNLDLCQTRCRLISGELGNWSAKLNFVRCSCVKNKVLTSEAPRAAKLVCTPGIRNVNCRSRKFPCQLITRKRGNNG